MTTPAQQAAASLRAQLDNGSLAGTWTLDPARSTATLRSKSVWGLAPVKGAFEGSAAEYLLTRYADNAVAILSRNRLPA